MKRDPDARVMEDPSARLESALIDAFLRAKGVDPAALKTMPAEQAQQLFAAASAHAASKLAEVDCRAHFIHEIHGES